MALDIKIVNLIRDLGKTITNWYGLLKINNQKVMGKEKSVK